jgi:hypothetical protein
MSSSRRAAALSSMLILVVRHADGHRWAEARLPPERRDEAAFRVATHIAWQRCDGAPQYFSAWHQRYDGGTPHSAEMLDCLIAFLGSESIGTRAAPASHVHLEGFVAEHIWHLLILEDTLALGTLVRVDGPDWSVTDSGGDGLEVHRVGADLVFRLWESKAHTGEGTVREVVNGACRQIDSKALRYLARFSKVGQSLANEELQHFYGSLPQLWREGSRAAGGGVSVSTKSDAVGDCFANFPTYWTFTDSDQRLGLVIVIDDYAAFANLVREHLWKGL